MTVEPLSSELFAEPEPQGSEPPVEPLADGLPFASVGWEAFEKFCVSLAEDVLDADRGRLYGERGDDQQGIDIYVDLPAERHVIQCRRVAEFGPAAIRGAADDFLNGTWADASATFIIATTQSLRSSARDGEVRTQRTRLADRGQRFETWDEDKLNELLRSRPALVERFFGPAWRERFCPSPSAWQTPELALLPSPTPVFEGRAAELATLETLLGTPTAPAYVAIHGLGGAGKTQLAAAWAQRAGERYATAIWCSGRTEASLTAQLAVVARQLHLGAGTGNDREDVDVLRSALRARQGWLIILDGVADPTVVGELLDVGAAGHLVVTSQQHGGWRAAGARPVAVGSLLREDARLLLTHTSGDDDHDAADTVCERLGDLAIAVQQAGAFADATATSLTRLDELLSEQPRTVLGALPPASAAAVSRVWELAFDELESGPAGPVLAALSWLANEPIGERLQQSLVGAASSDGAGIEAVRGELLRFSMVTPIDEAIIMHSLVAEAQRMRVAARGDTANGLDVAVRALDDALPRDLDDDMLAVARQLLDHVAAVGAHLVELDAAGRDAASILHRAGDFMLELGRPADAARLLETALACVGDSPDEAALRLGILNDHAIAVRDGVDASAGEAALLEVLAARERLFGTEDRSLHSTLTNIAVAQARRGQPADARRTLDRAIDIARRNDADALDRIAGMYSNRGTLLLDLEDPSGALADFDLALTTLGRLAPSPRIEIARTIANRANALLDLNRLDEAIAENERAVALKTEIFGELHPTVADSLSNLGNAFRAAGHFDDAVEVHRRARRILEAAPPSSTVRDGLITNEGSLGLVLWQAGEREQGVAMLRHAATEARRAFGDEHVKVTQLEANLSDVKHHERAATARTSTSGGD